MSQLIKLNSTPSLHLKTKDDLVKALAEKPWEGKDYTFRYLMRSDFIVDIIHQLAKENGLEAVVYNSMIKERVRQELGLPKLSDAENAQEGDDISKLVYNAQEWRRMDMLKKAGFVLGTQEILDQAFAEGKKIELPSGSIGNPREVQGKVYAMKPNSRTRFYVVEGEPIRLLTQKQVKAIEKAEKDKFKPDANGVVRVAINIGGLHFANLEAMGIS